VKHEGGNAHQTQFAGDLSASQQELVWNTIADLFDAAVVSGTINPLQIAQLGATWKGRTDFLGWAGASRSLDPEIHGPLAYIFAHRFLRRGQPEEAGEMFRAALFVDHPYARHALGTKEHVERLPNTVGSIHVTSRPFPFSPLIIRL